MAALLTSRSLAAALRDATDDGAVLAILQELQRADVQLADLRGEIDRIQADKGLSHEELLQAEGALLQDPLRAEKKKAIARPD